MLSNKLLQCGAFASPGLEKHSDLTPTKFAVIRTFTFHACTSSPNAVGTVTSNEVSESMRNRNTTLCESRSVTSARVERPARDLFCCQKAMSDWNARHSNSRCSSEASSVRPSSVSDVSEINLIQQHE